MSKSFVRAGLRWEYFIGRQVHLEAEEKLPADKMKKLQCTIFAGGVVLLAFSLACFADTFTHRASGEVLHGYATSRAGEDKTVVHTQEKGLVNLNLAEWQITADRLGRNNKVIILGLEDEIMLEIETEALEEAIVKDSNEGPLFILLEVDTPGGRTDLAQRICAAITKAGNCPVIAFVKGGKYGGAISAGAAVALACGKIYMANNTIIGAATTITFSESGRPQELKEAFGEAVGEKISSAWRAYLASLAEQNHRPGLLARAMVDRDIEVIEVTEAGKRLFIDPVNKKPEQSLVHTWSKKGSLLTLTAAEAVECTMADRIADSRQELLSDLGAAGAEIAVDDSLEKAAWEFKRAKLRFDKLRKTLDLQMKQMEQGPTKPKGMSILRDIRSNYKGLIALAKRYPDLQVNVQVLEEQLNSVEAFYQKEKQER
jgi:membrane-bound ClpP family serine protease